ncbi:hypothetical protein PPL_07294 [Heterostelium album PN500]|uniref:G8 domain-containing protein n=1 Tax=Heterostelium pallidum (strain ATCC 26659 / Pp 5 / PN500) TaxID=670386 RepID=D3BEX8_HETP5|nr:hypothetical protein PPL_07294 [Heterostelium album PN500]EFA80459.1 hypothetical protein PPL_07294 [Heterostelium album PN500]|eukprot:XP_020432579.1 hypothetical protein PPL_07294 [Heterostelium album PN500]
MNLLYFVNLNSTCEGFRLTEHFILYRIGCCLSQSLLGSIENVSNDLTIHSKDLETTVVFTVDNSILKPTIVLTLLKGSANFNDIVSSTNNKDVITISNLISPTTSNGQSTTTNGELNSSNRNGVVSIYTIISLLFTGLIMGVKSGSPAESRMKFIVMFIAISVGVSYTLNADDIAIKIDIRVPTNYQFNSLTLNIEKGNSIDLQSIQALSLNINACVDSKVNTLINLENAKIDSSLSICSHNSVNINGLAIANQSTINILTLKSATISFNDVYSGNINLETNGTPKIDGFCETFTNGRNLTGTCNQSVTPTLNSLYVSAADSIYLTVGTNPLLVQCSSDPTWREPVASGTTPSSPSIVTSNPETVVPMNVNSQWRVMAEWGFDQSNLTMASGVSNGVSLSGAMNFTTSVWGPNNFNLVLRSPAPAIKQGRQYSFDFDFLLAAPQSTYNTIKSVSIAFGNRIDTEGIGWLDTTPIHVRSTILGDWSSTTAWVSKTIQFTPPFDIGDASLLLQINCTDTTGDYPVTYFIRNPRFRITSTPVVANPTNLLTKDSELVILPKPSAAFDRQDRTTCPYLQSDLKHWHDPATWGGAVPSASSTITLPANTKVLVSSCSMSSTLVYQKIVVPAGSELIFMDADMTINVRDIMVNGKLIIGTPLCRYNGKINIIFNGAKTLTDTIGTFFGSKGIAVSSQGFLSINGKQYHNTWTKLAASAWPGERVVYLMDPVNWEVGQQVVVTTTQLFDDDRADENEVLTIAAIQGKTVQFTQPLKYLHYGGQEYQAEIGLISRRIVLKGASDSDASEFGGHVMMMGEGQISGVQLTKMGQKNIKARYPLHFHLAKTLSRSFISDCSVYDCFYRCYTIHGTNNVTVTRNVAFKTFGHCYYLEDGVEENNTLSYNFAARVNTIGRPADGAAQKGETFYESDQLRQPADSAAGGFYITNAYNTFIGNAASGGWAGFSFPNLFKPIGNFRNDTSNPSGRPILVFDGNSAHSSGYTWLESGGAIYVGGNLSHSTVTGDLIYYTGRTFRDTRSVNNIPVWMRYTNTKVFLSNSGVNHWGERIEIVGLESHDCHRPATIFGQALLSNAIVNGQSKNPLSMFKTDYLFDRQGFQFYDTHVQTILSNIQFRNYVMIPESSNPQRDNRVLVSMTHSDIFKPQGISATKNFSFSNVADSQIIGHYTAQDTGAARFYNFIDHDGSTTKRGRPTIVGSHINWWNFDSTCTWSALWSVWLCDKTVNNEIANVEIYVPDYIYYDEDRTDWSYVGTASLFGNGLANSDRRSTPFTRNPGLTGVSVLSSSSSNLGWYLYFNGGKTPSYMEAKYIWWDIYDVNVTAGNSVSQVRNSPTSDKYYFDGKHLYLKLINVRASGAPEETFTRDGVTIYTIEWSVFYYITAKCTGVANGFCPSTPDILPSL